MTPCPFPVSQQIIRELVDAIVVACRPQKIILFGSYAEGRPTPDSDVDLFVVLPFTGSPLTKAAEIRALLPPRPSFALDLVIRTPEDTAARLSGRDWFVQDVFRTGKVLYAA